MYRDESDDPFLKADNKMIFSIPVIVDHSAIGLRKAHNDALLGWSVKHDNLLSTNDGSDNLLVRVERWAPFDERWLSLYYEGILHGISLLVRYCE